MSKPSITNCPNTFFRKVHSFNCIFSSLSCFACVQIRHTPLSGGYCGGVPPLPIPNREVKPTCADGTAMQCGRVGRRLLSMKSLRFRKISEAFLFFLPADLFLLRWGYSSPGSFYIGFFLHRFSSSGFFFIGFHGWLGRQSCLSDYARILAEFGRWPMACVRNELLLFLSRRFRRWRRFFSLIIFLMDLHGFSLIFFFFLSFLLFPVISLFHRF